MISGLLSLSKEQRKILILSVIGTALEFYDWNRIINKTMEHYKKIQGSKKEQ